MTLSNAFRLDKFGYLSWKNASTTFHNKNAKIYILNMEEPR